MRDRDTNMLLAADAFINILLGVVLLLLPAGTGDLLGLPSADSCFYPMILGGVLFGIGIALLIEMRGRSSSIHGLALPGAIAINLCGGSVLLLWLLSGDALIPLRGKITLWIVAILVLGIGLAETLKRPWDNRQ